VEKPEIQACQSCHANEVKGFTSGKHGMRLSEKLPKALSPMSPAMGRLDFTQTSEHAELTCNSCHNVHELDTQKAATQSCLSCHADEHSLAYEGSPHGQLWEKELNGQGEVGSGVSCATCHMPRIEGKGFVDKEKGLKPIHVEHTIDALADEALIKNNFNGKPSVHVESVDWAVKRVNK